LTPSHPLLPRLTIVDDPARNPLSTHVGRGLAIAGAAVVVLSLGLGLVGATLGPPLPAPTVGQPTPGPASMLPSAPAHRVIVDPLTHKLSVDSYLVGQLPGSPFEWGEPTSTRGLFTEAILGGVTGDPNWKAQQNLPAAIAVADLEPATVIDGDLPGTARGVLAEFARRIYSGLGDLAVTDVRSDSPTTIGANPAQWAHASVTGTLTAGAEERSEVSLLLVGLPNGRHFVFIEVKPDRPSAAPHLAAIDAAARSITAAP